MKNLLLFCCLVLLFSCDNSMGPGKRYPIEQTHGHNHKSYEDEHNHDDEHATSFGVSSPIKDITNSEGNAFASSTRDLWQKPGIVLNHLGNLENKTMADIGAGPIGYFSFTVAKYTPVSKVLALDIDKDAIDIMAKEIKKDKDFQNRVETRLVKPNDPLLKENEVDVILISSTMTYIKDKVDYLIKLKEKLPDAGRLVIVDHKMKEIPEEFPPQSQRIALYEMEEIIDKAGFKRIVTDDISLDFQYIIVALKP